MIGKDGLECGEDPAVKPSAGLTSWPGEIVVSEITHPVRDLRMLCFETLNRRSFEGTEIHLYQLRREDRIPPDCRADNTRGGQRTCERAGEQRVYPDFSGDPGRHATGLAETVRVEGYVGRAVENTANIAIRLPMAHQIERRLTRCWVSKVREWGGRGGDRRSRHSSPSAGTVHRTDAGRCTRRDREQSC